MDIEMNDMVEVLNQETGERGRIRRRLFDNPAINNGVLVEVDPSQKPYAAELFKSRLTEPAVDPADDPDAPDEEPDSPEEEED